MLVFGVTGGIGSGKTVVCQCLKQKGIPIIEADPLAKQLTNRLPEIRQALTREFGADVYTPEGGLNVEKMSSIIFSDAKARQRVNEIIHPHVLNYIRDEIKRLQEEEKQSLVGVEAALIYESQMQSMLDLVAVVSAPLEKRIQWIQRRSNLSEAEIRNRIAAQMPLSEKVKRADYVIENDSSLADLERKVERFHQWLVQRTEA